MVSQTNEQALEASIEKALSGISREALIDQVGNNDAIALAKAAQYRTAAGHGYQLGWSSDYDREFAIDREKFWGFLNATQADELAKLKDQPNWQRLVLEHLNKRIKKVPRRFKWNSSKNLCQYSAKYWHEEKTWTATRYCYWDWGFSLPGN